MNLAPPLDESLDARNELASRRGGGNEAGANKALSLCCGRCWKWKLAEAKGERLERRCCQSGGAESAPMKQQQSRELEVEEERQRERPERKRGSFFGLEEEGARGESKDLSEGEMKTAPEKEEREEKEGEHRETEGERRFPPLNGPSTEKREEGMRTHLRAGGRRD